MLASEHDIYSALQLFLSSFSCFPKLHSDEGSSRDRYAVFCLNVVLPMHVDQQCLVKMYCNIATLKMVLLVKTAIVIRQSKNEMGSHETCLLHNHGYD